VQPFKPDVCVAWKSCGYFVLDRAQVQSTFYLKSCGTACFSYNHRPYLWNAT